MHRQHSSEDISNSVNQGHIRHRRFRGIFEIAVKASFSPFPQFPDGCAKIKAIRQVLKLELSTARYIPAVF